MFFDFLKHETMFLPPLRNFKKTAAKGQATNLLRENQPQDDNPATSTTADLVTGVLQRHGGSWLTWWKQESLNGADRGKTN